MTRLSHLFRSGTVGASLVGGAGQNTDTPPDNYFDETDFAGSTTPGNGGAIVQFETLQPFAVSPSPLFMRCATRTTAGLTGAVWTSSLGAPLDHHNAVIMRATEIPTSGTNNAILYALNTGLTVELVTIRLLDSGLIDMRQTSGALIGTTTKAITANKFFRLELHIHGDPTTGYAELRLYLNPFAAYKDYDDSINLGGGTTWAMAATATTGFMGFLASNGGAANWPTATGFIDYYAPVAGSPVPVGPLPSLEPSFVIAKQKFARFQNFQRWQPWLMLKSDIYPQNLADIPPVLPTYEPNTLYPRHPSERFRPWFSPKTVPQALSSPGAVIVQPPAALVTFNGVSTLAETVVPPAALATFNAGTLSATEALSAPAALATFSGLSTLLETVVAVPATTTFSAIDRAAIAPQSPASLVTYSGLAGAGPTAVTSPAALTTFSAGSNTAAWVANPPPANTNYSGLASLAWSTTVRATVTFSSGLQSLAEAATSPAATTTYSGFATAAEALTTPPGHTAFSGLASLAEALTGGATVTFNTGVLGVTLAAIVTPGTVVFNTGSINVGSTVIVISPPALVSFSGLASVPVRVMAVASVSFSAGASGAWAMTTTVAVVTFSSLATVTSSVTSRATVSFSGLSSLSMKLTAPPATVVFDALTFFNPPPDVVEAWLVSAQLEAPTLLSVLRGT